MAANRKTRKELESMDTEIAELRLLRYAIEQKTGRTIKSPVDFDFLALQISETSREQISPTTLKRLWGYIPANTSPRYSTLSLLARHLKYRDWEDFCSHYIPTDCESVIFSGNHIHTLDLVSGFEIEFRWLPDRYCVAQYEGNNRFLVKEAQNAQIHTGDRFTAFHFYQNYPLFITRLQHGNQVYETYIAGSKSGLTYLKLKI